jgi:hypothetical protein
MTRLTRRRVARIDHRRVWLDRPVSIGPGPFGSAAARPPPPSGDAKNGISKQGLESPRERDRHFALAGRLRAIINL